MAAGERPVLLPLAESEHFSAETARKVITVHHWKIIFIANDIARSVTLNDASQVMGGPLY